MTLADSHLNLAPSNGTGVPTLAPLQLLASAWPAVVLQPPFCRRSSSAVPLSNSWLPTALNSRPMRLSVSTEGSSKNSEEISGEAPIESPAPTTTVSGLAFFSASTCAAMKSAPPTGGRLAAGTAAVWPNVPGDSSVPW